MPECHRCPHQAEIDRLRAICSACGGPRDDAHRGRSFVSFEAARDSARILRPAPDWRPPSGDGGATRSLVREKIPEEALGHVREALRPFWEMSLTEWIVAGGKVRGMGNEEIASALGWTPNRVFKAWERVVARHGAFAAIMTGLDRKDRRRGKRNGKNGKERKE